MIFQRPGHCGPAAIVNACLALGHEHDVDEVASLAGTTASVGTDERGVLRALRLLQYDALPIETRQDARVLFQQMITLVSQGSSAILCVDGLDHWVAVIGACGRDRLIVFDSENTPENEALSGVRVLDPRQFRERLAGSRYAIRVSDSDPTNAVFNAITSHDPTWPGVDRRDDLQSSDDVSDEITRQLIGGVESPRDGSSRRADTPGDVDRIAPIQMPSDLADFVLGGGRR